MHIVFDKCSLIRSVLSEILKTVFKLYELYELYLLYGKKYIMLNSHLFSVFKLAKHEYIGYFQGDKKLKSEQQQGLS